MNRVRTLTVALMIGGVLTVGAGCGDGSASPKAGMMKGDGAKENKMTGDKK